MTTQYINQSVSYSDGVNILSLTPNVGLVVNNGTNELIVNTTGFDNGTQQLLFSDLYAGVQKTQSIQFASSTATSLNVRDTILIDSVIDTHQTHITNTELHILDTATNDEMFLDHNSLILVQPTTTHQTELLGTMLDFQTPENIISCGHNTYQDGHSGFEAYDLLTGDNSLLGITRLRITSASTAEESVLEANNLTFTSGGGLGSSSLGFDGLSVSDAGNTISSVITEGLITLTSGITSNTLDSSNWSGNYQSVNTSANATHYLNFSDSSSTGYGKSQKTTGISCNPSTKTITATTFNGTTFIGALSGNAVSASNVVIASDNTSGTYYIPFSKLSAGTNPLYVDDTTSPLTYNPSTGIMTSLYFSGDTIRPTTQNVATYTGSTLTISGASNGQNVSYRNSSIVITGGSNNLNNLTITNTINAGQYNIGILNSGSGNFVIGTSLGTNIRTIYSGSFNIPSGRYGLMTINVITINSVINYIVNVSLLTN